MKDICFYCHQEKDIETFKHPYTFQVKNTCSQCKNKLLGIPSYEKGEKNI